MDSLDIKSLLILAACVAIASYASCNLLKPHLVTRQQVVDPNLVNTYTGFITLLAVLSVALQNIAKELMK